MHPVTFKDIGLIDYKQCWEYQERLCGEAVDLKIARRKNPAGEFPTTTSYLIFCEHPHVYTLGKSGDRQNLLIDQEILNKVNATFYKVNRGGDITYHGPGQIVGYPILDLDYFFTDIHRYLRFLEEAIIRTLADYGIEAGRHEGLTGVWLDPDDPKIARKISAIGVRTSRWVTMHGFAFNVNTDLSYYEHIIPCGIEGKQVTSMQKELGEAQNIQEVKSVLKGHLGQVFNMELVDE